MAMPYTFMTVSCIAAGVSYISLMITYIALVITFISQVMPYTLIPVSYIRRVVIVHYSNGSCTGGGHCACVKRYVVS